MLDKKATAKLEKYFAARKCNINRGIYISHRFINEWAQKKWKDDGWDGIRPDHMRVLSIISMEPMNVNELSRRARVSKQAMSKMVNDLISKDFIAFETDPKDSRSKIISITATAVDFLEYLSGCSKVVEEKFKTIIGAKKTDQLISLLSELSEGILALEQKEWEGK
jgi:DNA-binding MarR family transcriptional regulator